MKNQKVLESSKLRDLPSENVELGEQNSLTNPKFMSEAKFINTIDSDNIEVIDRVQKVAEFMEFVNWSATPSRFRQYKNQKDLAIAIGVNEDTLSDWKKHPSFWPLMQMALRKWCQEKIPEVVGGLYGKACIGGKAGDVKMFLQLAGMTENNKTNK